MRNPYPVFYVSQETAPDNGEEGEDDAKSAWPFDVLGGTHDTMGLTTGRKAARQSKSLKRSPNSDRGLQLDLVKPESLVIANQPCGDEYVPGSCTHRQSFVLGSLVS